MWRTMFSISTMASSTRIPVDSVMARKLTRLSEKPRRSIAQEQQHDDDGENSAFEQRRDRGLIIAFCKLHRRVDQFQIDIGIGDLQHVDALLHGCRDHDV